jgi:hypothetical protein
MASKIISFIVDTVETDLEAVLAAAIDKIHIAGATIKEIRLTDDSGETKVPVNTVAGVTVPEPVTDVPVEEPPVEEPPVDAPVDPPVVAEPTEPTEPTE